jgi:luciferase family oxidoreductase group 1
VTERGNRAGTPLSVLDAVPVFEGTTTTAALARSVALAQRVEKLGYRRYWVAEHHNTPGQAVSSPAVLAARLASATADLRVGSGGVMLPNHPPLIVAEQFNTLAALFPGRVDLGVGRAPGTDPLTAQALRRVSTPEPAGGYAQQIRELLGYLHPADRGDAQTRAQPVVDRPPGVWLLGSSEGSARLAGELGLPLVFAHHLNADGTEAALAEYRTTFRASAWLSAPYVMVSVAAFVADTDERAEQLTGPIRLNVVRTAVSGRPVVYPSEAAAAAYAYSEFESEIAAMALRGQLVGGPELVRGLFHDLVARTGADEVIVAAPIAGAEDQVRSYELLAEIARTKLPLHQ